nr:hypothetical protein [Succinivibrionaceae bacterium]
MSAPRTASHYLERQGDLPAAFRRAALALAERVASQRILDTSLQGLCGILGIACQAGASGTQGLFMQVRALLQRFGMALVPCSIPCDLAVTDSIYAVTAPDLYQDEDCFFVKQLMESGRTPALSDMPRITRMNEKMANYNVMLRVFEALFVISSGKLGSHQRSVLADLLGSLRLPADGLRYLRACYSFASEQRNCHCDFTAGHCFRPLKEDLTERVCECLAAIAAASPYLQPFNEEYPEIERLRAHYRKYRSGIAAAA